MAKITLINDKSEYDDTEMTAIVLNDESEIHPNGKVYPVLWVGYGDDIMMYCSEAWVNEQEVIKVIDNYEGDTDYEALYENIMIKEGV